MWKCVVVVFDVIVIIVVVIVRDVDYCRHNSCMHQYVFFVLDEYTCQNGNAMMVDLLGTHLLYLCLYHPQFI